eukprot:12814271-Prorocentrum_lima.AAC.1
MTSSLVGSEMCIRDSPAAAMSAWPMRAAVRPEAQWRISYGTPSTPGAVSYTHLTLPTICSV